MTPCGAPPGDRCPDPGVIARARHLADVVQQGRQHEQVRSRHVPTSPLPAPRSRPSAGRRYAGAPRCAAAGSARPPTPGSTARQADQVEALPHPRQAGPAGEQVLNGASARRPGRRQRRGVDEEVFQGHRGERQPGARRRRGAQPVASESSAHPDAEHDLPVVQEEPVPERAQAGPTWPDPRARARCDCDARRTVVSTAYAIRAAAGTAVSRSSASGCRAARRPRRGRRGSAGRGAAGHDVDGVADVEQARVRVVDLAVRAVGEPAAVRARSTVMSRSPPRASLRSGSRR